jgi:hypothetical protein
VTYLLAHKSERAGEARRPGERTDAVRDGEALRPVAGEKYDWSSARRNEGWFKHGVCTETDWPLHSGAGYLTRGGSSPTPHPLGAYYRVRGASMCVRSTRSASLRRRGDARRLGPCEARYPVQERARRRRSRVRVVGYDRRFSGAELMGPEWGIPSPAGRWKCRGVSFVAFDDFD